MAPLVYRKKISDKPFKVKVNGQPTALPLNFFISLMIAKSLVTMNTKLNHSKLKEGIPKDDALKKLTFLPVTSLLWIILFNKWYLYLLLLPIVIYIFIFSVKLINSIDDVGKFILNESKRTIGEISDKA